MKLYPDQQRLVESTRQAFRNHKRVLMQSPTGSGKTAMAIYMLANAKMKNKTTIFAVPRRDLMSQTSQSFDENGLDHSFIAAGKETEESNLYIGMIDTMSRRTKKGLPYADFLIVDESHFGASALDNVINHYTAQGAYILGLSATPWKLSGKGLGCWYDTMVKGESIRWLIDNKRLSDYRLFAGKVNPDFSRIPKTAGDYNQKHLGDFFDSEGAKIIGDTVVGYKQRALGKLHIVRCVSIKESQRTADQFNQAGIPAAHLDGNTPDDEKKRILMAYAKREIFVLTFCELLNFGFDLSMATGMDVCVESCSDLRPSKSLAGQMQFWGRILRFKPYPAIINDHVNNWLEHGVPCIDRNWSLSDRGEVNHSNSEKPTAIRQCSMCYHCHTPAPLCPSCGYEYPAGQRKLDQVAGGLSEVKERSGPVPLTKDDIRKKTAQLIAIAKKRRYSNPEIWAKRILTKEINRRGLA